MSVRTVVWRLDAYAPLWLPLSDLVRVVDWMDANGVERASVAHEVRVEDRDGCRWVVCEQVGQGQQHVRRPDTCSLELPLRTDPPEVYQPCGGTTALQAVLAVHARAWPAGDPTRILCAECSSAGPVTRVVAWPCPGVREAAAHAGVSLDAPVPVGDGPHLGSDLLDAAENARVFSRVGL